DVFLLSLSGCDTGQCYSATSYGDWSLTQGYMAPGMYYIAVDGANGAAGTYTLALTCQSGPVRRIFLPLVIKGG
ncbi:MAG: hypothetical protein JXR84_01035, partial [Anaerolineae bacterium]|nr:hypothetical protein [Anaerolineae bacterium]